MDTRDPQTPKVRVDLASPRIAVAVINDEPSSDDDWADYVETTSALGDSHYRTVVFTAGGGPTVLQQVEHDREAAEHDDVRLAVIHGGAGTATRWLGPESARVFAPEQLDEAFGFLELSARERARVLLLARRLARELDLSDRFKWS